MSGRMVRLFSMFKIYLKTSRKTAIFAVFDGVENYTPSIYTTHLHGE